MNIIWVIIAGMVGFLVGRKSARGFFAKSPEVLEKMREEVQASFDERTEKRKEQIVEMMKDFEVQQKIVEKCDIKNRKKGIERVDVEKRLGVSRKTALKYLDLLEDEKKIRQVGKVGKDVYYELGVRE